MKLHQILLADSLSYSSYLSIVSALKVHTFESYNLWVLQSPTGRYFPFVSDQVTTRVIEFDFLPQVGSYEDWCELPAFEGHDVDFVNRCLVDFLMWKILHEEGGMVLDMDTLSLIDCASYYEDIASMRLFKNTNTAVFALPDSLIADQVYAHIKEAVMGYTPLTDTVTCLWDNVVSEYIAEQLEPALTITDEEGLIGGTVPGRVCSCLSDTGFVWDKCNILDIDETSSIDETFIYRSMSPYARLVKRLLPPSVWNPTWVAQPRNTVRANKTFHLLGLPHLPTNKQESLSCAYTQKVIKLATMLKSLGHRIYFYGLEGSEVECDEFIQVASRFALEQSFGKRDDLNAFYNLDHGEVHAEFSINAAREINLRKNPTDFLLCMYGWGHKSVADVVNLPLTVEPGIGYMDTFSNYRVFESYTWMSHVYGINSVKHGKQWEDGQYYDAVIPNYFDPADFEFNDKKGDYLLFVGRIIHRKGIETAMQAAQKAGIKLVIAGQHTGDVLNIDRPGVEYVGYVGVEERKKLYRDAIALLVPTVYMAPFEGVHMEAAFSGTPVITTDWGVFGETVLHGVTGYRCRTFEQFVWAIKNIHQIDPHKCYNHAISNFSMERIKWMYDEYFDMLLDTLFDGWYTERPDRAYYDAWTRYCSAKETEDE